MTASSRIVAIAGSGAVAQALGKAMCDCGLAVHYVASRNVEHAKRAAAFVGGAVALRYCDIPLYASHVIVAVTDEAIPAVAEEIARANGSVRVALHTCGAAGPELLAPLAAAGVCCAAMHPLQTVRDPARGAEALRMAAYAVCGGGEALGWAEEIARALSGHVINVGADSRPLYHAAAVMASNYVVALLDAAEQLMLLAGVQGADALPALAPLIRTSIDNVLERGTAEALTGPIVRGDAATVARHLDALESAGPSVLALYRSAGLHALELSRRRGLGPEQARRVQQALLGRE